METLTLFPINVYKHKVDPNFYDKQNIINACKHNYTIDPNRNNWDNKSELHHTYNDWDNPKFEKIDVSTLIPVYVNVCHKLLSVLDLKINVVNLHVAISNVSVNTVYMKPHNHFSQSSLCIITGVHYLSLGDKHTSTIFMNPSLGFDISDENKLQQNEEFYFNTSEKIFNKNLSTGSCYHKEHIIQTEEDDIILFPTHLNHYVKNLKASFFDKPRIVVAFNLLLC